MGEMYVKACESHAKRRVACAQKIVKVRVVHPATFVPVSFRPNLTPRNREIIKMHMQAQILTRGGSLPLSRRAAKVLCAVAPGSSQLFRLRRLPCRSIPKKEMSNKENRILRLCVGATRTFNLSEIAGRPSAPPSFSGFRCQALTRFGLASATGQRIKYISNTIILYLRTAFRSFELNFITWLFRSFVLGKQTKRVVSLVV